MKVFISAKYDKASEVKNLQSTLEELGHTIIVDWASDDYLEKPYHNNKTEAAKRANRDIEGVMECDIFVLLHDEGYGKGIYVELGAAIACTILKNKPQIFVLDNQVNNTIFYFHDTVTICKSIDEFLDHIMPE